MMPEPQLASPPARYRIVRLPKRRGGTRTIYVPDPKTRAALRHLAAGLTTKAGRLAGDVVHGFTRHRSPVTNALHHVNHRFTLSFDLSDFFDHVTPDKLAGKLSKTEMEQVFVDGAARQGLPTSPAVANLAFASADQAILKFLTKHGYQVIYTRYADDLTFSFDDPALTAVLRAEIPAIVRRGGWAINPRKTEFFDARWGRRRIAGVMADDAGVYAPREFRRRLRAAGHRLAALEAAGADPAELAHQRGVVRGMRGWATMAPPHPTRSRRERRGGGGEPEALRRAWRLPRLPKSCQGDWEHLTTRKVLAGGGDWRLDGGVTITADPCQMLGMSTWTTGWTSCMAQPHGQYRQGVLFWVLLAGTSLAYLPATTAGGEVKTITVAGVTRPRMRARALVHQLRNGQKIYDRVYGDPESAAALRSALEGAGFRPAHEARGELVVGTVPASVARHPYLDSLTIQRITLKNGTPAVRCAVR